MKQFIWFYFEATRLALQSIFAHKLRSFLTLLGIIIGVASVRTDERRSPLASPV